MANATLRETVTKPLYAYVGAGDKAVELVRKYADELQSQVDDVRKTGLKGTVGDTTDALAQQAKNRQIKAESYLKDLQAEALALPKRAEARFEELQDELRELTGKVEAWLEELRTDVSGQFQKLATYGELVARGEKVLARLRGEAAEAQAKAGYKADSVASKSSAKVDKAADKAATTTAKTSRKAASKTKSTTDKAANKTKSTAEKSASKGSAQATRSKAQATRAKSTATKKAPAKSTTKSTASSKS